LRFLFVDEILELEPGRRIVAARTFREDEEFFRDHFPGFPVVPGVLLTETMGQAAGKCLDAERLPRGRAMLARIRSASFRRWVRPGERAVVRAEVKSSQPQAASAECRLEVDGALAAQADLLFAFVPASRFALGFRDEVLDRFLEARRG
jgi:3-hydroxyacyl-[acyl-carrier-protein] dehydratase